MSVRYMAVSSVAVSSAVTSEARTSPVTMSILAPILGAVIEKSLPRQEFFDVNFAASAVERVMPILGLDPRCLLYAYRSDVQGTENGWRNIEASQYWNPTMISGLRGKVQCNEETAVTIVVNASNAVVPDSEAVCATIAVCCETTAKSEPVRKVVSYTHFNTAREIVGGMCTIGIRQYQDVSIPEAKDVIATITLHFGPNREVISAKITQERETVELTPSMLEDLGSPRALEVVKSIWQMETTPLAVIAGMY